VDPTVRVQGAESEVRVLIYKASIFSAQGEVPGQDIISAYSVQESASSLTLGTGNRSAYVAGGIKDQTSTPGEHVGADPPNGQWKVQHQISRNRVLIGLDSGFSETGEIFLRVSVVTIIAFRGKPAVDVITVSTMNPPVSEVVREIPWPLVSLVKKPVPCRLIPERLS